MGRPVGSVNRATAMRREMAEEAIEHARTKRTPLAKEVLAELMVIAKTEFDYHHRKSRAKNRRELAGQWFDRCAFVGKALAPFESPTMRAIVVAPPPELRHLEHAKISDDVDGAHQVQEITLRVFEGGRLALPMPPKKLPSPDKEKPPRR